MDFFLNMLKKIKKTKPATVWLVFAVAFLAVFFFATTVSNVSTQTYDLELFTEAKETIRSPITIENKKQTEEKLRLAMQSVEDQYTVSREISEKQIGFIKETFDAIEMIEKKQNQKDLTEDVTQQLTTRQKVRQLEQVLSPQILSNIDTDHFKSLVKATESERSMAKELLVTSVYEKMNQGIRKNDVEATQQELTTKFRYSSLNEGIREAMIAFSSFAIVENSFFDNQKTLELQQKAEKNTDPVIIHAGDVIVKQGDYITKELFEELALVGVLTNDREILPYIGLAMIILVLLSALLVEWLYLKKQLLWNKASITSVILISVCMLVFMKLISLFDTPVKPLFYIMPAATGAMLLKYLINERFALVIAGVYAVLGAIIFNYGIPGSFNIEAGIYLLLSQWAGIYLLNNLKDRLAPLKAGLGLTIVNVVLINAFLFLSFEKYVMLDIFIYSMYGVLSAFLASVLTLGLLPFFETGLGILSDTKLLTLANPNHPLLRKILIETPGTYHHSVMVANISEAACESIGANGLLARVSAYYHDLGKTVKPHYFIENQMGLKNPHDMIEPEESAQIIIKHPYDGSALLRKYRMPQEIIDITEQHHGTTLLKYFYYKAKKEGKDVKEEAFRYPGPKPQTREAAIVCICDSVEAAVRSLQEPSTEKIEGVVSAIMSDRLKDGQLNESPLTLKELDMIQLAICETLQGIFHQRIQYPHASKTIKEAK